MHLSFVNSIRSAFSLSSRRKKSDAEEGDEHAYVRGDPNNRGPCPGLNALANMGYLPRDGKAISIAQVEAALTTALHMNGTLASAISRPLKDLLHEDSTFDLRDMRRHNVIEHDISFTRLDARQGDNYTFQPAMFRALLDDAGGGPVTVRTLAKTYVRRHKEHKASGGQGLGLSLWFVNLLQTVSLLNTAQTGGELSRELMTTFYTEERFPEAVLANQTPRTLLGLVGNALKLWFHVVF